MGTSAHCPVNPVKYFSLHCAWKGSQNCYNWLKMKNPHLLFFNTEIFFKIQTKLSFIIIHSVHRFLILFYSCDILILKVLTYICNCKDSHYQAHDRMSLVKCFPINLKEIKSQLYSYSKTELFKTKGA